MLIRCNVTLDDLTYLRECMALASALRAHGYRIAYAVNKDGYAVAQRILGKRETVYRITGGLEEDAERLIHLHRKHGHKYLVVNLPKTDSAYLFHLKRIFDFVALVDRGSAHFIHADAIINPSVQSASATYQCDPKARLLMGPRFALIDPDCRRIPERLPTDSRILLAVPGVAAHVLDLLLKGLARVPNCPPIDVLAPLMEGAPDGRLASELLTGPAHPVPYEDPHCFPFESYGTVITTAEPITLLLARRGLFFMTIAAQKSQLHAAYMLEQLGVSPTLGWYESTTVEQIAETVHGFLRDPNRAVGFAAQGPNLVDGQGTERIVGVFPPAANETRVEIQ